MKMKRLEPIPPGEILEEEFMRPLGLSANALARRIDVPVTRISEIVRGKRGITADTALRLARLFGTSSELWLGLQAEYDLRVARRDLAPVIEGTIVPLKKRPSTYGGLATSHRASVGEQVDPYAMASTRRRDHDRRLLRRPSPGRGKQDLARDAFFGLADRLALASDAAERESLKQELARLTFGATAEFDREMVAEEFGTLTPRAKSRWKKASQRPDRSKARVRK